MERNKLLRLRTLLKKEIAKLKGHIEYAKPFVETTGPGISYLWLRLEFRKAQLQVVEDLLGGSSPSSLPRAFSWNRRD